MAVVALQFFREGDILDLGPLLDSPAPQQTQLTELSHGFISSCL